MSRLAPVGRLAGGVVLALAALVLPLHAQSVPERRVALSQNVDFPGGDLTPIFETDFATCRDACLADRACGAFTFNIRANACFPKTGAGEAVPYEGALSGRVFDTDPAILAQADARAADLDMLRPEDLAEARALARALPERHVSGEWQAAALADAARDAAQSGNPVSALRFMGAAINLTDRADQWVEYARLAGLIEGGNGSETRRWRETAIAAGINGYLRGREAPVRASALAVIGKALQDVGRGRESIPVLRLANDIAPRFDLQDALDDAIARFGFRITEHRVDSDSAAPRICATFSEDLVQAGVDYTPFVQVPVAGLAVEADGQQICIDGVAHGERYRVVFREGLPAASGEVLMASVPLDLYVRDRTPAVRFAGRGYVLPAAEMTALPVVTVNVTDLDLVLSKVSDRNILALQRNGMFGKPLSRWDVDWFDENQAERVWDGTATVTGALNRDTTSRLPLGEAVGALAPGLYTLRVSAQGADEDQTPPATQWFVVSDLGVLTMQGTDGLHVAVRSLADTGPKAGAEVQLVSRANAVLATAVTDADGFAGFAPGLTRGTGAAAPALLTVRMGTDDFAFLSLTDPEFDLSDRGVEGRPAALPIDVFLTTERGAYRVGETIHVTALARDGRADAVADLPLTAILSRPDGVEYARQVSEPVGAGGHVLAFPLGLSVPRGTWKIALHADPEAAPLVTETVLVEDFLPERIDVTLSVPDGLLPAGEVLPLEVQADYLFGAPAGDLPVSGFASVAPSAGLPGFPGVVFGRHDERPQTVGEPLPQVVTGPGGAALVPVSLPEPPTTDRPYEARLAVEVREGNARPVERRITMPLAPTAPLLGLRPLFEDSAPENGTAGFEIVGLSADLAPEDMAVRWTLNRVETRYQWYQLYGDWTWEPVTRRTRVATGDVTLENGRAVVEAAVAWGRYELEVERLDGTYAAASTAFSAGWWSGDDASATPDLLAVTLDKPAYAVGDTAVMRATPESDGTLLVTVLSDRLIDRRVVPVTAGEIAVEMPVTDAWGSGAYVTATLLTPVGGDARMPTRALGLAHAAVDPGDRALSVALDAPEVQRAGTPLEMRVTVAGAAPGERAWLTLAAVDVGILNLTSFAAPDPQGHYFGQRRLGVGLRDLYGRLIDATDGALGVVRSGGDGAGDARLEAPPPTEDLAVWFSGPVQVDAAGQATLVYDPGPFNGTLRLMAVAWTARGVGQAVTDVILRDPVVLSATLPRFLAPGDESVLRLELTHADGPAGDVGLGVTATGPLTLAGAVPNRVTLPPQGRQVLELPIRAGDVGDGDLTVALRLPDGTTTERQLRLGVRANDPEVTRSSRFTLAAGDTFTVDRDIFAGFRAGTGHAVLSAGALARFDAPGLLAALDRYPWGCTEQITSRALPLLDARPLALAMGLDGDATLDERLQQAIGTVMTRQTSSGAFGLWRPESGDLWLDAYVTDFLSRARAAGLAVPDVGFRLALDNLRNQLSYVPDFDSGGQPIAYALYVLAREGAAATGDLRYYADVKADAFSTPLALAQLGAALASYGDQTRADRMFRLATQRVAAEAARPPVTTLWRIDYGTARRDAAAVLALALEAGSTAADEAMLVAAALARPEDRRSTQEAVWALRAATELATAPEAGFTVNDEAVDGPLVRVLEPDTFAPLAIRTRSTRDETLVLTTFGVPEVAPPAGGNGYSIDRRYFTMEGEPVTPERVRAGDRFVTLLTVRPSGSREGRLMVVDPLPAGFEIDNPSMLSTGDVAALEWLTLETTPSNVEFRSDQFRAAVDHYGSRAFQLAYIVRAVSPGSFHHPAAMVEDMYRPHYRAVSDTGRVTVVR